MKKFLFLFFLLVSVIAYKNNSAYVFETNNYINASLLSGVLVDASALISGGYIKNVSEIFSVHSSPYSYSDSALIFNDTSNLDYEFNIKTIDSYNSFASWGAVGWLNLSYDVRRNFTVNASYWLFEDFENDITSWVDYAAGCSVWNAANDANTINWTYSAYCKNAGVNGGRSRTITSTPHSLRFKVLIPADTGTAGTYLNIAIMRAAASPSRFADLRFEHNTKNIMYFNGGYLNSGADWQAGVVHDIIFNDIDWTAHTYDVVLDGVRIVDDSAMSDNVNVGWDFVYLYQKDNGAGDPEVYLDDMVYFPNVTSYNVTLAHEGNITEEGAYILYDSSSNVHDFNETNLNASHVSFNVPVADYEKINNFTLYYKNNSVVGDLSVPIDLVANDTLFSFDLYGPFNQFDLIGNYSLWSLSFSNLTQINLFYNLSFFYELNGSSLPDSIINPAIVSVVEIAATTEWNISSPEAFILTTRPAFVDVEFWRDAEEVFSRTVVPSSDYEILSLFWFNSSSKTWGTKTLTIDDITGRFFNSVVYLKKSFATGLVSIVSHILDAAHSAKFDLIENGLYQIFLVDPEDGTKSLGFWTPGSDSEFTVDVSSIPFSYDDDAPEFNITSDGYTISFYYYDPMNYTSLVYEIISNSSGIVYETYAFDSEVSFDFNADPNSTYFVFFDAQRVGGNISGNVSFSFAASALNPRLYDPVMPDNWLKYRQYFAAIFTIAILLVFSRWTIQYGIVAGAATFSFFFLAGWFEGLNGLVFWLVWLIVGFSWFGGGGFQ